MRFSGRTLLLLLSGVIVAFSAILVKNRLMQVPALNPAPHAARIVIARHDILLGSFVQGDQDLAWGAPPADMSPAPTPQADNDNGNGNGNAPNPPVSAPPAPKEAYLYEGSVRLSDFNGAVARRELHAGDPVPQSALMKSGEGGFMSAVLDAGMRAISISVTAASGNAGFVSPGDHVDLIVTHHVKPASSQPNAMDTVVSETFVRNVRVVAIDQMLDNPDNKPVLAKTITVEVTPREAEQVAVAEEMGKISVALRSLIPAKPPQAAATDKAPLSENAKKLLELYGKGGDANTTDYTRDSDISTMLEHKNAVSTHVHVIRGDQSENLQF